MNCPHCKSKLTLMQSLEVKPEHADIPLKEGESVVELQYNCENCTHDYWLHLILPLDAELKPIFWG